MQQGKKPEVTESAPSRLLQKRSAAGNRTGTVPWRRACRRCRGPRQKKQRRQRTHFTSQQLQELEARSEERYPGHEHAGGDPCGPTSPEPRVRVVGVCAKGPAQKAASRREQTESLRQRLD